MFTPDILNLIIGTVIGGLLKIWAKKMEIERQKMDIISEKAGLSIEVADAAAKRVVGPWGAWTRRVIALTVVGYLFAAPLILLLIRPDVPVIYAYPESDQGWLWFMKGPTQLKFIEAEGLTILPFQRQLASMIAGFYFGSGVVK